MKFLTASERAKQPKPINVLLHGKSGSGKTTQAQGLPAETTLFIDFEAGTLALQDWQGPILSIRDQAVDLNKHPWELAQAICSLCSGPDMTVKPGETYSKAYYDKVSEAMPEVVEMLKGIKTIYLDSLSDASRVAYSWCSQQPYAVSKKTGNEDGLAIYGALGREMVAFAQRMQHAPKDLIAAVILDEDKDNLDRTIYTPQLAGQTAKNQLIGIFDIALTIHTDETEDGVQRCFYTQTPNKFGYPAKDRSDLLSPVEVFQDGDKGALWRVIEKARSAFTGDK